MKRRGLELHRSFTHRERADSDRVVIRHPDISERRSNRERKPQLVVVLRKSHRRARIYQRRDLDLPLGAVGADHQIIEPRKSIPVEKTEIVAGRILFEIFRLDSKPLDSAQRALSRTHRPRALDAEHHAVQLAQEFGLESACREHRRQVLRRAPREPT